jgi:hypothetical protein
MFYVYEFVIPSIEIISSIIVVVSMIIIIVVVVVMIIIVMFQVNLGPICLSNLSNVSQKIIYKQSINKL